MISKIIQSIKLYLHRKEKFYGLSISEWGFVPGNKGLYTLALLHKSASRYTKSGTVLNYERLEFLGDAVLGAIVAEILYKFFPNKDEGFMTRLRSKIVSRLIIEYHCHQNGVERGSNCQIGYLQKQTYLR
ncbi:MAG: ribonuclease III domain-containing protein [Butyricimonas faecihominis]